MDWTLENTKGEEVDFEVDYNITPGEPMIMNPPDRAYPGSGPEVEILNTEHIEELLGRELTDAELCDIEEAVMERAAEEARDAYWDEGDRRYHAARDEGLI